jgi:hypothetical protein
VVIVGVDGLAFGYVLALTHWMNTKADNGLDNSLDDREWRRLCSLVLAEPDPQRISELVERLLKELDAWREMPARKSEKSPNDGEAFEPSDR